MHDLRSCALRNPFGYHHFNPKERSIVEQLQMKNSVRNLLAIHMKYWPSQVLLTAVELDLFNRLGDEKLSAQELGDRLGLSHPRGTYDFFDALVALEFLDREGDGPNGQYKNIPEMRWLLTSSQAMMFGGYEVWSNLATALKTGKTLVSPETHAPESNTTYDVYYGSGPQEFFYAMESLQQKNFERLAEVIDFTEYRSMADIGCASGLLARIMHEKFPQLKIICFDLPSVAPHVQDLVNAAEAGDRVSVISGDFFEDDLPCADVIAMGNVLHNWELEKKKVLVRKAFDALPDGGAFIVIENMIDNERRKNPSALLLSLNMLIEFGSNSFTPEEFQEWCLESGFKKCEFIELTETGTAAIAYK
jgi:SAM-dependent methyltransferase